ncbi:carboxypeptidase-like regulatory domain-containing protein [Vibrio sp. JC009]|uniref:carboxypeptidase-like regulatory domain-containing protein n=1 Tax=Vibrio sp. JC009 TaxID=2912314 RepID=UPI0023AF7F9B|nr:carboxypeptidase-like regulatory domain-containing protein [Vibrio sp. JC009]WED22836.1 carboxypeptidase-like regulatory domain-containing protein [Vibrio sp. JC009]
MTKLLSKFAGLMLLILCTLSVSLSAYAHKIRMSVYPEESYIEGEVYFVGGANPAGAGVKVQLLKDGKVVGTAVADEEGFFTIDPVVPDSYSVRGDGGQGHVAYYELCTIFLAG